jgi:hypothetical protein
MITDPGKLRFHITGSERRKFHRCDYREFSSTSALCLRIAAQAFISAFGRDKVRAHEAGSVCAQI